MTLSRYQRKKAVVDAVRYFPGVEIPGFTVVTTNTHDTPWSFLRHENGKQMTVIHGHWITIQGDTIETLSPKEFNHLFEPIED